MVRQWLGQRPVRRLLRRWNPLTLLATAGVVVSVAGLLLVIGVGQVQIFATKGGSADLFADDWIIAGVIFAAVGIVSGCVSLAAMSSQGKARREFPALRVEVIGGGTEPLPNREGTALAPHACFVGLRIWSLESSRLISLKVGLMCDFDNVDHRMRIPPMWKDAAEQPLLRQVRVPVDVAPQSTVEGFFLFDLNWLEPHLRGQPTLELVDNPSGTSIEMPSVLTSFRDTS